jgi:hypothetical protein
MIKGSRTFDNVTQQSVQQLTNHEKSDYLFDFVFRSRILIQPQWNVKRANRNNLAEILHFY